MRLIAIGDVHGEITMLRGLLEALAPEPEDHLIFLGDYVDRGEDNRATLEHLIELAGRPNTVMLMGNHELMMLDALHPNASDEELAFWLRYGGDKTAQDYEHEIPVKHVEFLRTLPLWHRHDKHVFVHAGLLPGVSLLEQLERNDPDVILWERDHLKAGAREWEPGMTLVCGHTPQRHGPLLTPQLICIDTGAGYGGPLTAIDLTSRELTHAFPDGEVLTYALEAAETGRQRLLSRTRTA